MSLPDDNSIPFPYNAPETWDQLRLKGISGQEYVWPTNPKFGVVRFDVAPPPLRIKKSVRAGGAKPKVKDVGKDLAKATLSFEIVDPGWPSFVANVWRLSAEFIDGPWRLLHPLIDAFDARSFKVETYLKIGEYGGGRVLATLGLLELDPDEQAGLGKNIGSVATGAAANQQAFNVDAFNAFQAQQIKLIQDQAELANTQRQVDASKKPGVHVMQQWPPRKATVYGKISP